MVFIVLWIMFAVLGAWVGSMRNRTGAGFLLGLLLGIFGVIIVALLPAPKEDQP